jgi:ribosomal protein S17E
MHTTQSKHDGTFKATVENENVSNSTKNYVDLFSNHPMKSLFAPFNGLGINDGTSNPFWAMVKQVTDYNKGLFNAFTKQFEGRIPDLKTLCEKYQDKTEKQVEASKTLTNSLVEAYNKQMGFTLETNKKLQEEVTKQMTNVFKLNQGFWSNALNISPRSFSSENFSKDGAANENKIQTKVPA